MGLESKIILALKGAMKNKDQVALTTLRAIKSEIILQKTQKTQKTQFSNEDEMKLLQKMVKQRKDSAIIYKNQNRNDLAEIELKEAKFIQNFLPKPLSESELKESISLIIDEKNASGMKDMGMVMRIATKKFIGKADGKIISKIVRELLS